MLDERTERLITRKLDGEIREDELLELNKRLIRDPEARALLEEYERNDALAVSTLQTLLRAEEHGEDPAGSGVPTFSRSHLHTFSPRSGGLDRFVVCLRYIAGGLVAAAAVLALVVFQRPAMEVAPPTQFAPMVDAAPVAANAENEDTFASVIDGRRNAREELDQNVIGVYDEGTQSWYMLELERKQTKVIPVSMSF